MGHGTPLMPGAGDGESGVAMPHMLDVGLSSTDRIAAFFGIAPEPPAADRTARSEAFPAKAGAAPAPAAAAAPKRARAGTAKRTAAAAAGGAGQPAGGASAVQKVIEDALKAAGLMR
jgi:hypothetical protein